DWTNLLAALLLGVLLMFCYYRLGQDHSILWVLLGLVTGLGVLVVAQLPFGTMAGATLSSALLPFTAGALASFALVLTGSGWRLLVLVVGFLATLGLQVLAAPEAGLFSFPAGAVVLSWVCFAFVGFWVSSSVPRAARRIYSIGRAHRAER